MICFTSAQRFLIKHPGKRGLPSKPSDQLIETQPRIGQRVKIMIHYKHYLNICFILSSNQNLIPLKPRRL